MAKQRSQEEADNDMLSVDTKVQEALRAAWQEFSSGRLQAAARRLRRLVKAVPEAPEGWYWLGRCKFCNREFKKAEVAFWQALELKPDYWEACRELGILFRIRGRLKDAVRILKRGLAIDFCQAELWLELGRVYTEQKRHDKAFLAFRRAAYLRPSWKEAQMHLGFCAARLAEIVTIREVDAALERLLTTEELKRYWQQLIRIMGY